MEYISEFRDEKIITGIMDEIHRLTTKSWTIMEICGGQTHAIKRYGIDQLLPGEIELVHGPGCPVCVTPLEMIDKAIAIASLPDVIFISYGDMLRVPGSTNDLLGIRANGGDVRVVYSPLDALNIVRDNQEKQIVFFAIGFETTAPANAMVVLQAEKSGLKNFCVLVSHVRVPPAMNAILGSPSNRVQGFLAAGHVCAVMGYQEYLPIAEKYKVPIVVTGFEPLDIAHGILMTVQQLESGRSDVINAYTRVVSKEGNLPAQKMIEQVFMSHDQKWRGIGMIPDSGWKLRPEYAQFDAEKRFSIGEIQTEESALCISGQILQGVKKPDNCQMFGTLCTPEHPLGATMVSSEGACAAYYKYGSSRVIYEI
jgi:hydrogenase expression/formation protein HypD